MSGHHPPGHRLGHRLRPHRRRLGRATRSRSGTSCASAARSPTRDRYGGVWLPTRHEDISAIAYDTEHFTSRSVVVDEVRPLAPAPHRHRAADHVGPAVPPRRPPPAAARLRARRPSSALEPFTRELLPRPARRGRRARPSATRPPTTRSTSRCGSSPRCSASRTRTPTCSAGSSTTCSRTSTCRRGARRRELQDELDAYLDRPGRGPRRAPARRPHLATCSRPRSTASRSTRTTSAARSLLLLIAGIDTTWSAIGASLWHLADAPRRPRAASSPSPS